MWSWAVAAHRNRAMLVNMPWFQYSQTETSPWEVDITEPQYYARIMNEINAHVQKADVVVFQMVHTPAALNLFLTIKEAYPHIPVVAEIDDNILSTPEYNPANPYYSPGAQFRDLAVQQFRAADAMIVSTPYLRDLYSDLNPNVHVVENSTDFKVWDKVKRKEHSGVRIGWAGGASHAEDLRIVEPVIRKTLENHKNARFVIVHGIPDFLKEIDRVDGVQKWSRIDKYPKFLGERGFDIGMAPLVDNAFNRGKSNLRWLEYGSMRVPCVASDVGHFAETIRNGVDGILCRDEKDWLDAFSHLIAHKTDRRRIGNAAYERIRKDFNTDTNVFAYESILRGIVEKGQVNRIEMPEYAPAISTSEAAITAPGVLQ